MSIYRRHPSHFRRFCARCGRRHLGIAGFLDPRDSFNGPGRRCSGDLYRRLHRDAWATRRCAIATWKSRRVTSRSRNSCGTSTLIVEVVLGVLLCGSSARQRLSYCGSSAQPLRRASRQATSGHGIRELSLTSSAEGWKELLLPEIERHKKLDSYLLGVPCRRNE